MTSLLHEGVRQAPRVPVTVNGIEISYADITREVQHHPAPTPAEAWQAATRALAVRAMLLEEADRLGLAAQTVSDAEGLRETDEEALIRQVIEQQVTVPRPTEADCERYYKQNRARFRTPSIAEVSHILLSASKSNADAYAARRAEAVRCITRLSGKPTDFAKLANDLSDCSSAAQGGNLGQLSPGQTTPAFEAALTAMSPGDISAEPVESPYGFHIIYLERRIEGRDLPFEAVKTRIANYLTDRVSRTATAQYLARLATAASITGIDMPDVQDLRVF
jgi:peptidyl-prolyl cis-trans isomerase C